MGNVQAMSFRNSHIRTFDGRDIFIPNSMMIKNPLINYTKDGLMRHEFVVGIDYGNEIAEATKEIMATLTDLKNISHGGELDPFVVIAQFGTSTINLKIFFWINTYDFLDSITILKSTLMQTVVNTLLKKEFTLPADIVELKIYQEGHPIPLSIKELKDQKKNT
ncbi:MAG: small conductance mechanosensitive channel [Marivirga sp.]|jgi:small conductance mechanosensitive channel